MSETILTTISAQHALQVLRHVEPTEALEAGILTPMAGTRPIRLFSLEEAERFLKIHDGKQLALGGAWATVNYVEPAHLAAWISDVLGDPELGATLHEIAATRRPFGFLVPDMKAAIAARIEQCQEAAGLLAAAH